VGPGASAVVRLERTLAHVGQLQIEGDGS
jgi:hypothetical protein